MKTIQLTSKRIKAIRLFGKAFELSSKQHSLFTFHDAISLAIHPNGEPPSGHPRALYCYESLFKEVTQKFAIRSMFETESTIHALATIYYLKCDYALDRKIISTLGQLFYKDAATTMRALAEIDQEQEVEAARLAKLHEDFEVFPSAPGGLELFKKVSAKVGAFYELEDEWFVYPEPTDSIAFFELCRTLNCPHVFHLFIELAIRTGEDDETFSLFKEVIRHQDKLRKEK